MDCFCRFIQRSFGFKIFMDMHPVYKRWLKKLTGFLLLFAFIYLLMSYNEIAPKLKLNEIAPKLAYSHPRLASFQTMENFDNNNIPLETLDPNSEYFGLRYKDTYGLSSAYDKNCTTFYEDFTKDLPRWEIHFPNLITSLYQYSISNPSQDKKKFTAPISSCIVDEVKTYTVGETFKATIYATDFSMQRKRFGGDYFRARLVKFKTPQPSDDLIDGMPLAVNDNADGTYTVTGPLLIPGHYRLEVTLCASVEAIGSYVEWSAGRIRQGFTFEATLLSDEVVYCDSDLLFYDEYRGKDLCNYSNPRNLEPWFCSKPSSGICYPIKFITPFSSTKVFKDNAHLNKPFNIISELQHRFKSNQPIIGTSYQFEVLPRQHETESDTMEWIQKLVAKGKFHKSATSRPTGFSHNGRWVSLVQNNERRSPKGFAKCFLNKVVYLIGDSTMRQFFEHFAVQFSLKVKHTNGEKYYHVPRLGRHEDLNITIYYRAHGPPIRNPGPPKEATYITDTIDEIKTGGKDVAIVINFGLHYLEYDPMFFVHRLYNVKKSLEKHLERFPETKVLIKGFNVAELPALPFEWLVHRYDVILKEMLKNIKNSVFIDLWDMTTLWPVTGDYHPSSKVIEEQSILKFSHICD